MALDKYCIDDVNQIIICRYHQEHICAMSDDDARTNYRKEIRTQPTNLPIKIGLASFIQFKDIIILRLRLSLTINLVP